MENLRMINPSKFPYDVDEPIFLFCDDEGNVIGEPYSYNDWIKKIEDMAGINEDFLGRN